MDRLRAKGRMRRSLHASPVDSPVARLIGWVGISTYPVYMNSCSQKTFLGNLRFRIRLMQNQGLTEAISGRFLGVRRVRRWSVLKSHVFLRRGSHTFQRLQKMGRSIS